MMPVVQVQYFYIKNLKVVIEIIASNLHLKKHTHTGKQLFLLSGILHFLWGLPLFVNALIFKYTKLLNHKICSKLRSQASQSKDSLKLILQILMRIIFQFILQIKKNIYGSDYSPQFISGYILQIHSLLQAVCISYPRSYSTDIYY